MVYYFPVECIQNLLQMIMAQGFLHGGGVRVQSVGQLVGLFGPF